MFRNRPDRHGASSPVPLAFSASRCRRRCIPKLNFAKRGGRRPWAAAMVSSVWSEHVKTGDPRTKGSRFASVAASSNPTNGAMAASDSSVIPARASSTASLHQSVDFKRFALLPTRQPRLRSVSLRGLARAATVAVTHPLLAGGPIMVPAPRSSRTRWSTKWWGHVRSFAHYSRACQPEPCTRQKAFSAVLRAPPADLMTGGRIDIRPADQRAAGVLLAHDEQRGVPINASASCLTPVRGVAHRASGGNQRSIAGSKSA